MLYVYQEYLYIREIRDKMTHTQRHGQIVTTKFTKEHPTPLQVKNPPVSHPSELHENFREDNHTTLSR